MKPTTIRVWLGYQDLPTWVRLPTLEKGHVVIVVSKRCEETRSFNVCWTIDYPADPGLVKRIWIHCGFDSAREAKECEEALASVLREGDTAVQAALKWWESRASVINHINCIDPLPEGKRQVKPFSEQEMRELSEELAKAVGEA